MNGKTTISMLVIFFFSFLGIIDTEGGTLIPVSIYNQVKEAELIFEGVVIDKVYKESSQRDDNDEKSPHTFITFQIDRILKGANDEGSEITLRFAGGLNADEDGFAVTEGVPFFDLEDRVILFVAGNQRRYCPLAGWQQGLYAIIYDELYNSSSQGIMFTEDLEESSIFYRQDLLDVPGLIERLTNQFRELDLWLWMQLSQETRLSIENQEELNIPQEMIRSFLKDDFNQLIHEIWFLDQPESDIHPDFVWFQTLRKREETQSLFDKEPNDRTEKERIRLHRLLLEDGYPNMILQTHGNTIIPGSFHEVEELLTTRVMGEITFEIGIHQTASMDNWNIEEDIIIDEESIQRDRISPDDFKTYILDLVDFLHTGEELDQLEPVQSADPEIGFHVPALKPGPPPPDLSTLFESLHETSDEKLSEDQLEELNALIKNNFNPVLPEKPDRN